MPSAKEWFVEWFDTPYYHLLYKNRDLNEAKVFVENLMQKLQIERGKRILDLACGRGRHALMLNGMGYEVCGIDLSEQSIAYAKQFENEQLKFLRADMRDNFSAQISPFDLVLNLFTSFAYFENPQEEEKVLANLLEATKEDGLLVIDFFNTQTVLENLTPHEQKTEDGVIFDISREAKDGFIFKHVRVKDGDKIMQYSERVRALRLSDFYGYSENLAKKNAFFWQIENVFGDYEFNNYNEAASKRMILLMRKKKSNEQFEG